MSPRHLPLRPNSEHLRNQAKDLLKAYRAGNPEALKRLRRSTPHLRKSADEDLVELRPTLRVAQQVVAAEYGFASWTELLDHIHTQEQTSMIELTIHDIRQRGDDPLVPIRAIILKAVNLDQCLAIFVPRQESELLDLVRSGKQTPRPMSHDLMDSLIGDFGATVSRVVITRLVQDTFHAELVIQTDNGEIDRDCRPSDAIGLAVRCGAPIYATEEVMEQAALDFDPEWGEPISDGRLWSESSPFRTVGFSNLIDVALKGASNEATRLSHEVIQLEDLFRALAQDTEHGGVQALAELGIDVKELRSRLDRRDQSSA